MITLQQILASLAGLVFALQASLGALPYGEVLGTYTDVPSGKVLQFDGVDDSVLVLNHSLLKPADAITLEAWAYLDDWKTYTKNSGILDKSDQGAGGYLLRTNNSDIEAMVRVDCNGINSLIARTSKTALTSGWHHLIGTFNGTEMKLYIDGVLKNTATIPSVCTIKYPYSRPLFLGRGNESAPTTFFAGRIDEARIYNKAISDTEALAHYNDGNGQYGAPESGLVGGWHLDESDGTVVDFSGNNHIAQVVDSPRSVSRDPALAAVELQTPLPVLVLPPAPTNNEFFASPTGSFKGNGSDGAPWDLKTALAHPVSVKPGATIWLKGGAYKVPLADGSFISKLTGTQSQPIKVRPYNNERVIMDGNLSGVELKNRDIFKVEGTYTWFMDFEVTNTDPNGRVLTNIASDESNRPDRRGGGVGVMGPGSKLINLIIYDTGGGIGAWGGASDSEYYGNVIFNNGWISPSRGHGHGIYTQNQNGTKLYKDNFVLNSFGYGVHMYGSGQAFLNNFTWENNILFNDSQLFGGGAPINNLVVKNNYFYVNDFSLGYSNPNNSNISVLGNYVGNARLNLQLSKNVNVTGNTIVNKPGVISLSLNAQPSNAISDYTFSNNTYYKPYSDVGQAFYIPSKYVTNSCGYWWFNKASKGYGYCKTSPASWQEDLGYDLNSTFIDGLPTEAKYFVNKNIYNPNRGNITIYNWPKSNSVDVDVSYVLAPGDGYELRNVQDYFGDVIKGTYTGGNLSVPMIGHTVAKPLGYDQTLGANTFPEFGAFVLIKTSSGGGTPAPASVVVSVSIPVQKSASTPTPTISATQTRGDLNGDGIVNSIDYSIMSRKWNQTQNITAIDINGDGVIDSKDYLVIKANWMIRR